MRRTIRCLTVAALSSALIVSVGAQNKDLRVTSAVLTTGTTPAGPCYLPARVGESTRHSMKRLIRCVVALWPVPGGAKKAICVADRESHLNPRARTAKGTFLGLFQHYAPAWPFRFARYTKPKWELSNDALDGRSNTVVTIRMIRAAGWGPWAGPRC